MLVDVCRRLPLWSAVTMSKNRVVQTNFSNLGVGLTLVQEDTHDYWIHWTHWIQTSFSYIQSSYHRQLLNLLICTAWSLFSPSWYSLLICCHPFSATGEAMNWSNVHDRACQMRNRTKQFCCSFHLSFIYKYFYSRRLWPEARLFLSLFWHDTSKRLKVAKCGTPDGLQAPCWDYDIGFKRSKVKFAWIKEPLQSSFISNAVCLLLDLTKVKKSNSFPNRQAHEANEANDVLICFISSIGYSLSNAFISILVIDRSLPHLSAACLVSVELVSFRLKSPEIAGTSRLLRRQPVNFEFTTENRMTSSYPAVMRQPKIHLLYPIFGQWFLFTVFISILQVLS